MKTVNSSIVGATALLVVSFLEPSSAEAQVCPGGYSWSSVEQRCLRSCPRGFYFNYVTGRCKRRSAAYKTCPKGWFWSSLQRRCVKRAVCPSGFYFSYSQNRCIRARRQCLRGHYYDAYNGTCQRRCPQGWRWTGSRCQAACPTGQRFDRRAGRCVARQACPAGTRWNGRVCVQSPTCPRGMVVNGSRCVSSHAVALAPVRPARPAAMSTASFNVLFRSVTGQTFGRDKISTVGAAARTNHFTCAQVSRLLSSMTFSNNKLKALRLLAPRIVDAKNAFTLLNVFTFSSDKSKARRILSI